MEENLAILMADLSGYTALTETHGSVAAADLIDKYICIVENSLVGDCKLHQRTGDEIMIVSTSPDFLIVTAQMIAKNTSNENHFLQLHGGMHYGKVLKRNDNYFGSAINLTSRIVAKANAGAFWCSDDYVNELSNRSMFTLKSKGNHLFKNVSKEKEIFELCIENKNAFFLDPVCRMIILDSQKAIAHPELGERYFCSQACLEAYRHTLNK